MKRLTVLAVVVGVAGGADRGSAADPPVTPSSPGWRLPDYGGGWRRLEAQTASGPAVVPALPGQAAPRPRPWATPATPAPYDPVARATGPRVAAQSTLYRPADVTQAGHKEPVPLPAGYAPPHGAAVVGGPGGCPDGSCGGKSGSVWSRFTGWLCFRQTPVKLGLHPVPYQAPLYTYFPCQSGPGCGGGAAGGAGHDCVGPNCAGSVAGRLRGSLLGGRGCAGPSCPPGGGAAYGPVDPGLPGYRLASPENPAVGGMPAMAAPAVTSTSYRAPLRP